MKHLIKWLLSMDEAETHPHATARSAFTAIDGVVQPAPGPRFDGASPRVRITPQAASRSDPQTLAAWGFPGDEIAALQAAAIVS